MSFATRISAFRARMAAAFALVLCAVALGSPAQAAVPERRVALVIGNSAYTAVPPLANPMRDARGMSAALKRLGFDVVEGYDLKMDDMTNLVRQFAQKLDGAKAGLVYYAGHGIAVGDENYLIPVDATLRSEADLDFRAVNVQLILRQMQRDERVNIVILDACRDNPFASQLAARSRSVTRGLQPIETQSASGILIAFATDPRATALDGERDGHSPFTDALLKHIETPEVSITTVMDRVRADVWEATGKKQKPWTNSSIIGEFKLNPTLKLASADPTDASTDAAKAINAAVPTPSMPAAPVFDRSQIDVKTWEAAERGNSPADYRAYLDAFPSGQFATFARNRLASLESAAPPANAASAAAPGVTDEALKKETGTAQTETAMKLDAKGRRELQTRLRASGFQPGKLAAKFGPSQRQAIQSWQKSRSIPETGFLTALQATALREQSEPAYQRLLADEAKAAAEKKTRTVERKGSATRKVTYEGDEMYQRDVARERGVAYEGSPARRGATSSGYQGRVRTRGGDAGDSTGAAIFGGIVGGVLGGAIGGGFRR